MPPIDSWLTITLQMPLWAGILIALTLFVLLGVGIWVGVKHTQRVKKLEIELGVLRAAQRDAPEPQGLLESAGREEYLQFIYNISHEVSNPLQSIQTNLDNLAQCTPAETGRWQQYHSIITEEIRRLSALTENLRTLSRLETPGVPIKREAVNVKGVIERVMLAQIETAERCGVRLIYNGPERPGRVLGNRDHLQQVLFNLVDNSIKYAHEGGGIVEINVLEQGDQMLVRVIDDGIGISPDDLPFVFETAYQAPREGRLRRTGSGLGLAIVRKIVEQHGGQVQIHSQPGAGTTVIVSLPLYAPAAAD
jgi:signal transduction histidine kinase